jgi:hypothetical protein
MPRQILAFLVLAMLVALPASAAGGGRRGGKRSAPAATSRRTPPDVNLSSTDVAATAPAPATTSSSGSPPQRGPTRIDFDDRLIQGQTNRSGAVYLYDRKELKQRSMVKVRQSFREEILKTVYDR